MTIREAISPKNFYETLTMVVRSFLNWQFYKKTMKALQKDGSLKQNGLRLDRRCRAYYIINLEPETLMMGEEVLELEKSRVFESISRKKPMFEKAGLGEIIEAKTQRIKTDDYYAYLIQIKHRSIVTVRDVIYSFSWIVVAGFLIYEMVMLGSRYQEFLLWFNTVIMAK